MEVPLSGADITDLEIEAVVSVLRSSRLSLGPYMEHFEELVANYVGVPHAAAVSSGTAGLHLCLCALGVGAGDEVIVPSFTFIAAANAVRYVGATPVFVDIDAATLNVDPARVEEAITPRTRAILVVHTFGHPAEMDALLAIAQRHGLRLIEDACEALGAVYKGRRAGSFGDAAVFAFYPNKQITTGEGGVVVTRNAELARNVRALRNQGRYETDDWHQHSVLGFNYRMSEMPCALGCTQMQRLDEILARREAVASAYAQRLGKVEGLTLPLRSHGDIVVSWFVYVVRLGAEWQAGRDEIVKGLQMGGIQCGRYFAPIHSQPAYSGLTPRHTLAVTEAESARTIALPFFTRMSQEQIQYVSEALLRMIGSG